jgi:putative transposase
MVWATKRRAPLLTPEIERRIHRCIVSEAEGLKCAVKAIGGTPDHVHVVLWLSPLIGAARLAKQMKGVSSALANDISGHQLRFRWQEGYSLDAVCDSHLSEAVEYARNQKRHHTDGTLRADWEETPEDEMLEDEPPEDTA